jgi:hypothetical protein
MIFGIIALVLAHEAGHAIAAQALGLRWKPFMRLPWKIGIAVWVDTPRQSQIIGLAGPVMNLMLVPLLAFLGQGMLAILSLAMATLPSAIDWLHVWRAKRAI